MEKKIPLRCPNPDFRRLSMVLYCYIRTIEKNLGLEVKVILAQSYLPKHEKHNYLFTNEINLHHT